MPLIIIGPTEWCMEIKYKTRNEVGKKNHTTSNQCNDKKTRTSILYTFHKLHYNSDKCYAIAMCTVCIYACMCVSDFIHKKRLIFYFLILPFFTDDDEEEEERIYG